MDDAGPPRNIRGTRPFEAMVPWFAPNTLDPLALPSSAPFLLSSSVRPALFFFLRVAARSKPWTAQFLSVDDVTARQSRRGGNSVRYRDGTLRADRPRPPPGAVPAPIPSPRQEYKKPDHPIFWETSGPRLAETTTKAGYSPRDGLVENLVVATRHALSPRYMKSSIGDVIFNGPHGRKPPLGGVWCV